MGSGSLLSTAVATLAAFGTYFCTYAFRKPFTAAAYAGDGWLGIDLKAELVIAQVLGYTVAKFVGIAVVAAMPRGRRAIALLGLVLFAQLALIGAAVLPAPGRHLCMFLNGLSLGMVFGLVLGFLEGRRHTEAMAAGLCASFIVADGATKSVGSWLLQNGVTEAWMPAAAGAMFLPPLAGCLAALARTPPPSAVDIAMRAPRSPMTRTDRRAFFRRHAPGLVLLVIAYLLVTILRSMRADFAPELWRGLGHPATPAIFTWTEALVAAGVLIATGCTVLVRDNRRAFGAAMAISLTGLAFGGAATLAQQQGRLGGVPFMILVGLGLYLPYVAVHTTVFERLVAMTRDRGNIGYLIYLADSFGYLGYVVVLLLRPYLHRRQDPLAFFGDAAIVTTGLGTLCLLGAWRWLLRSATASPTSAGSSPRCRNETLADR